AQLEYGAPSTIPERYAVEKLQNLAATEVPIVRAAACELLSYYRQGCTALNEPVQADNGVREVNGKVVP
ncbi:MAG: hypothetical protein LC130_14165, partial [Bryobacterales bacterium]|nr:hypothetical protein [Bryobacterales bacterium]